MSPWPRHARHDAQTDKGKSSNCRPLVVDFVRAWNEEHHAQLLAHSPPWIHRHVSRMPLFWMCFFRGGAVIQCSPQGSFHCALFHHVQITSREPNVRCIHGDNNTCFRKTVREGHTYTPTHLHNTTTPPHHNTTTPQHHNTTTPQHHNTTTPQHHNTTTPQHHNTTTTQHHNTTTPQTPQHHNTTHTLHTHTLTQVHTKSDAHVCLPCRPKPIRTISGFFGIN